MHEERTPEFKQGRDHHDRLRSEADEEANNHEPEDYLEKCSGLTSQLGLVQLTGRWSHRITTLKRTRIFPTATEDRLSMDVEKRNCLQLRRDSSPHQLIASELALREAHLCGG